MAKRSGTEIRKKTKPRSVRFSPTEDAAIEQMAQASGYSFAALVRRALFEVEPPRTRPHTNTNEAALTRLYPLLTGIKAEAGKLGSNVNQLAHHVNALAITAGSDHAVTRLASSIETAMQEIDDFYTRDIAEFRLLFMKAMGYERGEPED